MSSSIHERTRFRRSEERMHRGPHLLSALTAVLICSGCVRHLQPEVPSREVPRALAAEAIAASPPGGEGTVLLDVVDGPATVEELGGSAGPREVCVTPCLAHFTTGEHQLAFRRDGQRDEVSLTVDSTTSAYRRSLSYDTGPHTDYIGIAISGFTLGGFFGFILDPISSIDGDNIRAPDVGLIMGGVFGGAAFVTGIVGLVLALANPQTVREGASTQWTLEAQ